MEYIPDPSSPQSPSSELLLLPLDNPSYSSPAHMSLHPRYSCLLSSHQPSRLQSPRNLPNPQRTWDSIDTTTRSNGQMICSCGNTGQYTWTYILIVFVFLCVLISCFICVELM
jgi:hypothetical protein